MSSLNTVNARIKAQREAEEAAINAAIEAGKLQSLKFADKKVVEKSGRIARHVEKMEDDDKSKRVVELASSTVKKGVVFKPLDPVAKWLK
jgi:hypothetical protein